MDLRQVDMEFCSAKPIEAYNDSVQNVYKTIEDSEVVVFGMPVYQYSMSWVLKNMIDVCGWAMKWKQVWVIVNSGWPNCYMASQDLFNALFFEYGCVGIMPTPYSWSTDFQKWELVNTKVFEKLDELTDQIISL